jgi:nucleotide-binding universal stress UspA family protein
MIFMGTRGMTALANVALGSVTTRVLHLAHVPVLLVH